MQTRAEFHVALSVPTITQSQITSCGEAAIAMAYDYAHAETWLGEQALIEYGESRGLYAPRTWPFTSPANMVTLAQHYAVDAATGHINGEAQGLELLAEKLNSGQPVVIDITTRLYDPRSGAHFVVVTGLSGNVQNSNLRVSYNNPLTGRNESAKWDGSEGIWHAWQNNGDPGGSGWWLTIPRNRAIWLP